VKLDSINEMLFDFEELNLLNRWRLMTAPMVLVMFCLSLCFVDSSYGNSIESVWHWNGSFSNLQFAVFSRVVGCHLWIDWSNLSSKRL